MGILARFKDIMASNVNAALDEMEDPAKMIDQTLRNLRTDLAQVKKETASVMANDELSAKRVRECEAEIDKYKKAAANALRSGNEEVARKALAKKQEKESVLISLKEVADANHADAEKMCEMHNKLVDDIERLEAKKDAIKAKVSRAKAQTTMNKVLSGGDKARAGMEAFDRMEEKADRMLAEAEAGAKLASRADSTEDEIERYAAGCDADVDDELARMKAELGLS